MKRAEKGHCASILIALQCCFLIGEAAAAEPKCTLPPPVLERVGRAQIFSYSIKDKQELVTKRDIVWGDQSPPTPGIYSMRYMPNDRDNDKKKKIEWYLQNHSEWVMRRCNGQPAFEFDDVNVPVDTSNPQVRDYLFNQTPLPASQVGFNAIALDNVDTENVWHRCGIERGGSFERRYSDNRLDPAFVKDLGAWLGWLQNQLHGVGLCLAANHYYSGNARKEYLQLATAIDIIVDEHGFTRKCKPMDYDRSWLDRVLVYKELTKTKPFIMIDQVCPAAQEVTSGLREWSLANYLLIKGEYTYLAMMPEKNYGGVFDFPEIYVHHGLPKSDMKEKDGIYFREFEKVLALVNPSSHASHAFELQEDWRVRDSGQKIAGTVILMPGTAKVFVK